jgi:hypothetical protein
MGEGRVVSSPWPDLGVEVGVADGVLVLCPTKEKRAPSSLWKCVS